MKAFRAMRGELVPKPENRGLSPDDLHELCYVYLGEIEVIEG